MKKVCLAAFLVFIAFTAHSAEKKQWSRLEGCRYIADKNNDGDSFLVRCGHEEFYARFYFIDAPETNLSFPERVKEQYNYFGVTMDELTRAGEKARDFVQRSLTSRPFVIHTRRALAQGRSKNTRFYSVVEVDGRYLHEIMLSEGWARSKGTAVALPTGESSKAHIARLKKLEDGAHIARRGIWATTDESKRKSPF